MWWFSSGIASKRPSGQREVKQHPPGCVLSIWGGYCNVGGLTVSQLHHDAKPEEGQKKKGKSLLLWFSFCKLNFEEILCSFWSALRPDCTKLFTCISYSVFTMGILFQREKKKCIVFCTHVHPHTPRTCLLHVSEKTNVHVPLCTPHMPVGRKRWFWKFWIIHTIHPQVSLWLQ